jgi:hypothetical protein
VICAMVIRFNHQRQSAAKLNFVGQVGKNLTVRSTDVNGALTSKSTLETLIVNPIDSEAIPLGSFRRKFQESLTKYGMFTCVINTTSFFEMMHFMSFIGDIFSVIAFR